MRAGRACRLAGRGLPRGTLDSVSSTLLLTRVTVTCQPVARPHLWFNEISGPTEVSVLGLVTVPVSERGCS